ncbi:hypothetical protein BH11PLA2_BH11PLA2_11340 [soil metagenome]
MTDHEALLRAVCASPDDDLPRLVLADWLEEQGDAAQAEFIRAQVQLATTPPWEPFAVTVKHRRPDLLTGQPWRETLPRIGSGIMVDWNPDGPFRRGFGYSVHVKQLATFLTMAPQLLEVCPVGELLLPSGTREDWNAFANAPWLRNIRSLKFTFASNLIEPVRALAASPYATGLESVAFDVCTSPAMGVIVEALVQSPLAKQLKRLSFSVGSDTDGEIAEQLASVELPKLEELAFKTMSLGESTWPTLEVLKYTSSLRHLKIANQRFENFVDVENSKCKLELDSIILEHCENTIHHNDEYDGWSESRSLSSKIVENVRSCMIDNCNIELYGTEMEQYRQLRQLRLTSCNQSGWNRGFIFDLLSIMNWNDLVEVDVRGNEISENEFSRWFDLPLGPSLTAVVLDGDSLSDYLQDQLRDHFGERLVLK